MKIDLSWLSMSWAIDPTTATNQAQRIGILDPRPSTGSILANRITTIRYFVHSEEEEPSSLFPVKEGRVGDKKSPEIVLYSIEYGKSVPEMCPR